MSVGVGGLKTETGNFLRHFQNSESSNRCRSVYGTEIIKIKFRDLIPAKLLVYWKLGNWLNFVFSFTFVFFSRIV